MNDIELTREQAIEISEQMTLSLAVLAVGAAIGIVVYAAQIQPSVCGQSNTIFVQCTNLLFGEAKTMAKGAIATAIVFAVTSVTIGRVWGDEI